MHRLQLENISEAGLQLAIKEIRSEMFDTPHTDFTIAKMLSHCGHFTTAELYLDEMLLKWGSSPDVVELINKGYAMVDAMSATAKSRTVSPVAAHKASVETEAAVA
ncbi:hypothetical protein RN346_04805 [Halomonas sp. PAMB 3232]|uniref:hypothetical protein n=1 Tax=Halomonas sp. PAMB 3232 TaxID=3075221 RepID=UPI0028A01E6D|nr:hypothetical protein [Halomonas sp. PAMB 3232]WNL39882.1 hypothetical protein RN346_04805 [Halomonas sp. PAMB 3232]